MKNYCITHCLVCGSGFKVYIVRAGNEEKAKRMYMSWLISKKSGLNNEAIFDSMPGLSIEEITTDVFEAVDYADPTYEG